MRKQQAQYLLIAVAVFSLHAQTNDPESWTDHPSNGVMEISASQALTPGPLRRSIDPPEERIWRGAITISLRNVSPFLLQLSESLLSYEFTVLDSTGKPVAMTDFGKQVANIQENARHGQMPPMFSGIVLSLRSGDTRSLNLDLSNRYQIQPGQEYTVRIRYSHSMPKVDGAGKPITDREVRVSLKARPLL
jgi:hypothetical protein